MEITKELLEKLIQLLEAQKMQAIGRVNAIEGGIITIRGLLSDLDREEAESDGERAEVEPASPEGEDKSNGEQTDFAEGE